MKVAVGLSGGVDSSVAALLLKRAGHEVVGVTMKLWRDGRYKGGAADACFGPGEADDIAAAAAFADKIGIPYRVFDCSEDYEREIVSYFRTAYLDGKTPNPCVFCNARMKFGLLPDLAARQGLAFDKFATGHYARVAPRGGRHALLRAKDAKKDQSYFLYRLTQAQLARQIFPLGDLTKAEVRALAAEAGLAAADKPDSQDFYSGDRNELIGAPDRPGDIVTTDGRRIGRHNGFWHYTVGQRKGLNLAGAANDGPAGGVPLYVARVDACRNQVVVGRRDELIRRTFTVADLHWVSLPPPFGRAASPTAPDRSASPTASDRAASPTASGRAASPTASGRAASPTASGRAASPWPPESPAALPCRVKIRSTGEPIGPAAITPSADGATCECRMLAGDGLFGVTPGQSAVFYAPDSDELLCGGIITA